MPCECSAHRSQERASDSRELHVVMTISLECGFWYNCTEPSSAALFLPFDAISVLATPLEGR